LEVEVDDGQKRLIFPFNKNDPVLLPDATGATEQIFFLLLLPVLTFSEFLALADIMPVMPVNFLLLKISTYAKIYHLQKVSSLQKISNFAKNIEFCKKYQILQKILKFGQSNSMFLNTSHESLPSLLPSFFTLALLYFSPSQIWSTNYSALVFWTNHFIF
jgi:hypothetical protein